MSYVRRISHEIHFAWQAQYLVKLEGGPCYYTRIAKDASQVRRINHEIHFARQAQYLVKLECDFSWQVLYIW